MKILNDANNPIRYSASYSSTALLVANTPVAVVLPASNVNGVRVWRATFISGLANSTAIAALVAKATAPASVTDGDALLMPEITLTNATATTACASLKHPVFVPPGKGIYFIAAVSEAYALSCRSCLYTIL